ncbi:hypothetical protein NA57DRAFT_59370 [Rhizodiscina lignyota]|uniref:Uncharacterized protein n=1 Tax=Rhizodiscina lignyota TaxID=1504668 RepID=A0A9P4M262_9PEZI|nr:hypothetical protein NA57DRAFT_59370 [Rhizodiscina lignyota]
MQIALSTLAALLLSSAEVLVQALPNATPTVDVNRRAPLLPVGKPLKPINPALPPVITMRPIPVNPPPTPPLPGISFINSILSNDPGLNSLLSEPAIPSPTPDPGSTDDGPGDGEEGDGEEGDGEPDEPTSSGGDESGGGGGGGGGDGCIPIELGSEERRMGRRDIPVC